MYAAPSESSQVSHLSQQILDNVSKKSETKLFKMEANVNHTMINSAWASFGAVLARNLRMGKAIVIPKFGTITFTSPNVKLEGVTNPEQRDVRLRRPVFQVSKEFVYGMSIGSGIVSGGSVRPFSMKGVVSGIGETRINYTQIGIYAGIDKDNARVCIERVIKELSEKVRAGQNVEMDIPNLGKFMVRGSLAAIAFDDFLVSETLDATNKLVKEKKALNATSDLTAKNLEDFIKLAERNTVTEEQQRSGLEIDEGAQNWLRNQLDIDVADLKAPSTSSRPNSSSSFRVKKNSFATPQKSTLGEGDKLTPYKASRPQTAGQVRYPNKETNKGAAAPSLIDLELARKKIKMWMRSKSLLSEDAFYELATLAIGISASLESKLSLNDIKKGLDKTIGLNLSSTEVQAIYQHMDPKNTGWIDFNKWKAEFTDEKSHINYMRDIITKYNLQTDDILRRMGLNRTSKPLSAYDLGDAFLALDPSLDNVKALKLAKEVLGKKEKIEMKELIETLGCPPDDAHETVDWYNAQLIRIKKAIDDPKTLREKFENYDTKLSGVLDIASFKVALLRSGVGLNLSDINRLTRYIEKDASYQIDYVKFVELLSKIKTEKDMQLISTNMAHFELEQYNLIKDKLNKYLHDTGVQPGRLLRILYEKKYEGITGPKLIPVEDFGLFLYGITKEFAKNKETCINFAKKIDINRDGHIDDTDFNTFLNRSGYISEGEVQGTRTNFNKTTGSLGSGATSDLFPKVPLTEEKLVAVLRDLRQALETKGISNYDFVKMLDVNDVGFITIGDFSAGLDRVIKLSGPIKDGLFAYIDKRRIGMIGHDEIINLLKRSIIKAVIELSEDNFDWQEDILKQIKRYTREKNLSPEDAFRIIDIDFDGNISKKDLESFLKDILKVPTEQITTSRVARLFKLMDVFKRNSLQLNDFKTLIYEDIDNSNNPVISGGKLLLGTSTFNWKVHAKQQVGLVLSKQYPDLKQSFEEISGHNVKMTYKHFQAWIHESRALAGFDLTDKLLQTLFADLDPHKKGYINELDWVNAFGGYSFKNQALFEVQEALNANYSDVQNAYDYFLGYELETNPLAKEFTLTGFQKAIQALIPKRFDNQDIQFLWRKFSEGAITITFAKFNQLFGNNRFTGSRYISSQKGTGQDFKKTKKVDNYTDKFVPGNMTIIDNTSKEEKQRKLFDKVRQIILASNIPVEKFFKDMDVDKSGDISNLEFINAIRKLNLGLNLKEIEELILYCDSNQDGKISFQEFIRKFAPQEAETRLFDRSKNKLKRLKDNIYSYMLSPKDAFLTFNQDRTGKMTYDQFTQMVTKLSQLAREDVPSFPLIKDMFDFIDIRRDGIIDQNEWMQSFRLIENDSIGVEQFGSNQKKKSATMNVGNMNKVHFPNVKNTVDQTALNVSGWECSKEYEKVLKIVGKNRKLLISTFDTMKNSGTPVTFEKARDVIDGMLEKEGIKLTPEKWPYLLKFAEKDEAIDYKFLLDIFKERLYLLSAHPKVNVASY